MQSFDLIISGGGMVGLTLACGLESSGLHIAVLEQKSLEIISTPQALTDELRVSSINAASECLMQHIGVWKDILQLRASAYHTIEIRDSDSFGKITFRGDDYGFSHLGHIIENSVMQQVLWRRIQDSSNITPITSVRPKKVDWGENHAFITLEDERILSARLVIAADGAHSWLRQNAGIPLTFWDYPHHALVATIRSEIPHLATARQIFHGDGLLAFLPLTPPNLNSIVWSTSPRNAEQLKKLSPEKFNQQLSVAFDLQLGKCYLESERLTFPLKGRYARSFAAHRLALIGDAAHTLHPLAGQGVNLGFMDVAELVCELRRLNQHGKDIGEYTYLRRYERRRKYKTAVMLANIHGLHVLFNGSYNAKKILRGVGLRLVDSLSTVKMKIVHQAMGLNDLPECFLRSN